jgi:hypothetical protein
LGGAEFRPFQTNSSNSIGAFAMKIELQLSSWMPLVQAQ